MGGVFRSRVSLIGQISLPRLFGSGGTVKKQWRSTPKSRIFLTAAALATAPGNVNGQSPSFRFFIGHPDRTDELPDTRPFTPDVIRQLLNQQSVASIR